MLLSASILSIFILAIFSIIVIIKAWSNRTLVFFMMPIVVISGVLGGYSVVAFRGTPIHEVPSGNVIVMAVSIQKPDIFLMVKHTDTDLVKLYAIPYTKGSANTSGKLEKDVHDGKQVEGTFRKDESDDVSYAPKHAPPPPDKPKQTYQPPAETRRSW